MFGAFEKEHQLIAREYVSRERVIDLGCGDGERARVLSEIGAKEVLAIDYEIDRFRTRGDRVRFLPATFFDVVSRHDGLCDDYGVAHVAWPSTNRLRDYSRSLIAILERIDTVIYIGCNTGGTACGTPALFEHFSRRKLLVYAPSARNTLIVYGRMTDVARRFVYHEELCGLRNDDYAYGPQPFSASLELFDAGIYPPVI